MKTNESSCLSQVIFCVSSAACPNPAIFVQDYLEDLDKADHAFTVKELAPIDYLPHSLLLSLKRDPRAEAERFLSTITPDLSDFARGVRLWWAGKALMQDFTPFCGVFNMDTYDWQPPTMPYTYYENPWSFVRGVFSWACPLGGPK